MNITHQKTIEILKWFEELSKIPRDSGKEERIVQWMLDWAKEHNLNARRDTVGNVVIDVPASPGKEGAPTVVIQGHLDMVCEKTPDSDHDFENDPIRFVYDGEWLNADKTTLGADNGIAMAIGMTVALDEQLKHPPLELLFTVDEEQGGTGADALEPQFVTGRRLLNLDSETEGIFTVGCAGGEKSDHFLPLDVETIPEKYSSLYIKAGNMAGGHSADIHHEKANALKVLGRTLNAILQASEPQLAHIEGGNADNAIPRNAEAVLFINKEHIPKATAAVAQIETEIKNEFKKTDPDLSISVLLHQDAADNYTEAVTPETTKKIIDLIQAIPHGIYAMSAEVEHFVETSNNFASLKLENGRLKMVTMQRSPVETRLDDVGRHVSTVIALAGGTTVHRDRYPGWKPDMDSPLLKQCVSVYQSLYHKEPAVEMTHGGLECGSIGEKLPGTDMISFGPTICDPHSPDEKLHIPTVTKIWEFLIALLAVL
jgi:dipeptidase D